MGGAMSMTRIVTSVTIILVDVNVVVLRKKLRQFDVASLLRQVLFFFGRLEIKTLIDLQLKWKVIWQKSKVK